MRVGDSMYGGVENLGPQCVFCVGSTRSCGLCVGDKRFRSHVDIMRASAYFYLALFATTVRTDRRILSHRHRDKYTHTHSHALIRATKHLADV